MSLSRAFLPVLLLSGLLGCQDAGTAKMVPPAPTARDFLRVESSELPADVWCQAGPDRTKAHYMGRTEKRQLALGPETALVGEAPQYFLDLDPGTAEWVQVDTAQGSWRYPIDARHHNITIAYPPLRRPGVRAVIVPPTAASQASPPGPATTPAATSGLVKVFTYEGGAADVYCEDKSHPTGARYVGRTVKLADYYYHLEFDPGAAEWVQVDTERASWRYPSNRFRDGNTIFYGDGFAAPNAAPFKKPDGAAAPASSTPTAAPTAPAAGQ